MIRIPATRGKGTRTELRHVDGTTNPYLALAVILASGLDGILNTPDEELIPPVYDNIFQLTREQREAMGIKNMPENLKDAVKEFRADPLMARTLGEHAFGKYVEAKTLEWKEYRALVTEWELEKYLIK